MKRVFKYELDIVDRQTLDLPAGAEILCVQVQGGADRYDAAGNPVPPRVLNLWALVDDEAVSGPRHIAIFGTGHSAETFADKLVHLATVVTTGGALVWHVFEEA